MRRIKDIIGRMKGTVADLDADADLEQIACVAAALEHNARVILQIRQELRDLKEQSEVQEIARRLYRTIPGAPKVQFSEAAGEELWGYVEIYNHYVFCEAIAKEIMRKK